MPMKLLAALAQLTLPRSFADLDDIEKIRVLKAHGHMGTFKPVSRRGGWIPPSNPRRSMPSRLTATER